MFEPKAILVLRYVYEIDSWCHDADVKPLTKSYKNNDVNKPALHIGLALPSEEDTQRGIKEILTVLIEQPIAGGAYEVNEGVIKGA
jgi:hypothetical protein